MGNWIAVRRKDGVVCSLPTDKERAWWICNYLEGVGAGKHDVKPEPVEQPAFDVAAAEREVAKIYHEVLNS